MSVECIHIRDSKPGDYYCGREGSFKHASNLYNCGVLGNPFSVPYLSRDESIAKYREYIWDKYKNDVPIFQVINFLVSEATKRDIRLVCFCKPKACHTDVLKEMIERLMVT